MTTVRHNPGPGAYEPKNSINLTGHYVVSNMGNTLTPSMSLPSLDKGRQYFKINEVPGPGSYASKLNIGEPALATSVY